MVGSSWKKLKHTVGHILCRLDFHKHPKSSTPAWWTCEREGCEKTFHQKW